MVSRPVVDMIPYAAPLRWYAARMCGRPCRVEARGLARCRIASPDGRVTALTVPVTGGARRLSGPGLENLTLSDHGNWPHVHLGALEAAYGRAPYFRHLMPEIERLLHNPPCTLRELNVAMDHILSAWVRQPHGVMTEQALARGRELLPTVNPELSMIHALAYLGPETSLVLCALNDLNYER